MNRFLRVWAASFSVRTAIGLAMLAAMVLAAFALTVDPVIIALAAAASVIGIVIYARSKEQGIDGSLLSGPAAENRFLSFQLASGMDRKEYVDAYSWLLLASLPLIFMLFLVLMRTMLEDSVKSVESALTLTLLVVPMFYMIVHHNVCALAGRDRPVRFLAGMLLYILFFLGVLVWLIYMMDAPLLGLAVSAVIGIAAAVSFRGRSIETIMRADV